MLMSLTKERVFNNSVMPNNNFYRIDNAKSNFIEVVQGDIFMEQKMLFGGRLAILKENWGVIIRNF